MTGSTLYVATVAVQAYVPRKLTPQHLPPGIKACAPYVVH